MHEVAQRADPGARVVYADIDPGAIAHGKAILAGTENATSIEADLRGPEKILKTLSTNQLIDFSRRQAQIMRLFDGVDLVPPGLVYIAGWHPESPGGVQRTRAGSGCPRASPASRRARRPQRGDCLGVHAP